MAHPVAQAFVQAAERMSNDPRRTGSLVELGRDCEVLVVGDLHGNRRHLDRILRFIDLPSHPRRRLVLQEIIHGDDDPTTGRDRSIECLMRAVRAFHEHPDQVLFLMGNHDLAQLTGNEITKGGRGSCKAFNEGVRYEFEDRADAVLEALNTCIYSLPLAIRCGGVLMAHSLPSPDRMAAAGTQILKREYVHADLRRDGPVYDWTWGRNQTAEQIDALAAELGVEYFVLGHRHVASGFEAISDRAITIASDHAKGVVFCFDAAQGVDAADLARHVVPIAAMKD